MNNVEVRLWYLDRCRELGEEILQKIEVISRYVHDIRNKFRTEARNLMQDQSEREELDKRRPNMSFDEMVDYKIKKKGMDKQAAILDIIFTASTTNSNVNKEVLS